VSEATKHQSAGTVQSQGGRVGTVKQVGFEPHRSANFRRESYAEVSGSVGGIAALRTH